VAPTNAPAADDKVIKALAALADLGLGGDELAAGAAAAHGAALAAFVESALDAHARGWCAWVRKVEAARHKRLEEITPADVLAFLRRLAPDKRARFLAEVDAITAGGSGLA
jgi:hypothetical protein